MIKKILVPVDGSENANRALIMAMEMANKFDAKLYVLCVVSKTYLNGLIATEFRNDENLAREHVDAAMLGADSVLKAAKELVGATNVESEFVARVGEPVGIILDEAKANNADCIVIGCRGLSGLEQFLLGSVSHSVVNEANIPVFVVK